MKKKNNSRQQVFTDNLIYAYEEYKKESNSELKKGMIAELLKISPSTVSRWFNYDTIPSLREMQKLAELLNTSTEALTGVEVKTSDANEFRMTDKSMFPLFDKGDLISLKEISNWKTFLVFGKPYLIKTKADGFKIIRTIMWHDDQDMFLIVPLNTEQYEVQTIAKSEIASIHIAYKSTKDLI